jgi:predicted adenylyl cyclase CyaB
MREVELKSVVNDVTAARKLVEVAGGRLVFEGRLHDRRYDRPDRSLVLRDEVLRLRIYKPDTGVSEAHIDWKGPTEYAAGFKVRDEISTAATNADALATILDRLGYIVIREIDRDISQYDLDGAVIRFEQYPDMDVLVEVEGVPASIERAIEATGLARSGFTSERLPEFVARFEARTGRRAAICDRELAGDYRYAREDA